MPTTTVWKIKEKQIRYEKVVTPIPHSPESWEKQDKKYGFEWKRSETWDLHIGGTENDSADRPNQPRLPAVAVYRSTLLSMIGNIKGAPHPPGFELSFTLDRYSI